MPTKMNSIIESKVYRYNSLSFIKSISHKCDHLDNIYPLIYATKEEVLLMAKSHRVSSYISS